MRGGARKGAGKPKRKYGKYLEDTTTIRIPLSIKALLLEFLSTALKIRQTEDWDNWLNSWRIGHR